MSVFDHRYERANYGLKGPVRTLCCETIESSGFRRTESASFNEAGHLQEEIHKIGSDAAVVRRTFNYRGSLLLEETTYSDDRLLNTTAHVYRTGLPATSRFFGTDGSLFEEHQYEWQMVDGGGSIMSLHYGQSGPFARAFKLSSSSPYLSLKGVTTEHRLISSSGRVPARFLLDRDGVVRGLGLETYDNDTRVVSARILVGSSFFSDVFTIPLHMDEVATLAYDYADSGRSRSETLTRHGVTSVKTTSCDSLGNPLRESVRTGAAASLATQLTEYSYKYDRHGNWIERVIRFLSDTSSNNGVSDVRQISYY